MNSSTSNRRLLFLTMFLLALACFVGPTFAQKSGGDPPKSVVEMNTDQTKARQEISRSVAGSLILDMFTIKEPEWSLISGSFVRRLRNDDPMGANIMLRKCDLSVAISVREFSSDEDAEASFAVVKSHGIAVPLKMGDRGEKIFTQTGWMAGLNFRVGHIVVSIGGTGDEKLEEAFAQHIFEAIKGLASK